MIAKQEAKRDVLTQKGLTDTIRESLKTIDNAIEALKEVTENKSLYDKPYRIIEKSLEDTDSVAINNDSNFISKNRFAETLKSKRNPKREFENKYLDGEFHIVDIYADKEIIKLSIDEKTLYVDFSELSKADKATLLSKIANDGDLSSNLVRLQINVNCNEYRIKESKLHGFGEPREDAVSVSDIPIK